MRIAGLLYLLVLTSACAEGSEGVPTPVPQSPAEIVPQIGICEDVADTLTFHGDQRVYELTAPFDGTLVARVSYEPGQSWLVLRLADRWFFSSPPGEIIGTLEVVAGQQYRVQVADGPAWDYDELFLPFVLTTCFE